MNNKILKQSFRMMDSRVNEFIENNPLSGLMVNKLTEHYAKVQEQENDILRCALKENGIDYDTIKIGRFKPLIKESYEDGSWCYFYNNGTPDGVKILTIYNKTNDAISEGLKLTFNSTLEYLIHKK